MNMQRKNNPTVVSTFSGCGGSSLGYKLAGAKVLLAVEWDDHAVACYKRNFPDTEVYHGDIKQLSVIEIYSRIKLEQGELDIFDGSPPCQGFSTAGKRIMQDDRNSLFKEYCRLIKELQPKTFIMENVSGLIKGKMKIVCSDIFKSLTACGYNVKAQLLNAKHYGVPQARERVIFIGARKDISKEITFPLGTTKTISLREALRGCPFQEHIELKGKLPKLYSEMMRGENAARVYNKHYGRRSYFNFCRLDWDRPCPTITKSFRPGMCGLAHPDEPRFLTVSELKRCASFPDDFEFLGDVVDQVARIGNSVPPLLMKAIAEHVIKHILH